MFRDAARVTSLLCNLRTQRPQERGEKVREREREREKRGREKGEGEGRERGCREEGFDISGIQQAETSSCC